MGARSNFCRGGGGGGWEKSKKAPIRIKNTPHGEIGPYNDISFNFPKGGGGGQTLTLTPSRHVCICMYIHTIMLHER